MGLHCKLIRCILFTIMTDEIIDGEIVEESSTAIVPATDAFEPDLDADAYEESFEGEDEPASEPEVPFASKVWIPKGIPVSKREDRFDRMGRKLCKFRKRDGFICNRNAMKGSNYCKGHHRPGRHIVHGLYSKIIPADAMDRMQAYNSDPNIFKLNRQVAEVMVLVEKCMEGIVSNMNDNLPPSINEQKMMVRWFELLAKLKAQGHKIEFDQKYTITMGQLKVIGGQFRQAITQGVEAVVEDRETRERLLKSIGERLGSIPYLGSSGGTGTDK